MLCFSGFLSTVRVVSESNTVYQSIDATDIFPAVDPLTTIGVSNSSVMVAVCRCVGLSQYSIILRRVVPYRLSVYDVLLCDSMMYDGADGV